MFKKWTVEENAHAEAIEEFYTVDATMRENQAPPPVGRDFLVADGAKYWRGPNR